MASASVLDKSVSIGAGRRRFKPLRTRPILAAIGDCPDLMLAAKFARARDQLAADSYLVFTGGMVGPPTIHDLTRATVMIEIMNRLRVRVAVPSQHELQHGAQWFRKLAARSRFPWVATNLFTSGKTQPYHNVKKVHVEDIGGVRVGFIGVTDVPNSYSDFVTTDPVAVVVETARSLRVLCDHVVVLSQLDAQMAQQVCAAVAHVSGEQSLLVDLFVVGAHVPANSHGVRILQSGRDFDTFAVYNMSNRCGACIKVHTDYDNDGHVRQELAVLKKALHKKLRTVLAWCEMDIDCRQSFVRSGPSDVGIFLCDTYFLENNDRTDVVFVNGGAIGTDAILPSGPMTLQRLADMLPFRSEMVVYSLSGVDLCNVLQIGKEEAKKGDGLNLNHSLSLSVNDTCGAVSVHGKLVEPERFYRVCISRYLARSKPYRAVFDTAAIETRVEEMPTLHATVHDYFKALQDRDELGLAGRLANMKRKIAVLLSLTRKPRDTKPKLCFTSQGRQASLLQGSFIFA